MKQYTDIDELKKDFSGKQFAVSPKVTVGEQEFSLAEMHVDDNVFALYEDSSKENWIVLSWTNTLQPRGMIVTDYLGTELTEQVGQENITIRPDQLIGDYVEVRITSINNSNPVKGKVDTGANISSLHADEWKIVGDSVEFTSNVLSPNVIRMPVTNQNAVKTADGGIEYRPVVVLNVVINGKALNGVEFNLNNRSHMDDPVLIGQNALQKGKFFIDPAKQVVEDIDWSRVNRLIEDNKVQPTTPTYNTEQLDQLYKLLLETDIPFSEVVRHIKTQLIYTLENNITY